MCKNLLTGIDLSGLTVPYFENKYTAVGGDAGAMTGAVVSKNRVEGGIIGGVIGGGAGYLAGRHKDKKSPARKKVIKYKKKPA